MLPVNATALTYAVERQTLEVTEGERKRAAFLSEMWMEGNTIDG